MKQKIENYIERNGVFIAFILTVIGLIIIFISLLIKPFNDWSFVSNPTLFGQFGDFIGGFIGTIISIAGFLLIYKTFISQRESIEIQKKAFLLERNDNLFFNLLSSQQNITDKIKAYFYSIHEFTKEITTTVEGRDFFKYSKSELIKIWVSISNEYLGQYDEESIQIAQHEIDDLYDPNSFVSHDDAIHQEKIIEDNLQISYVNKYYGITKIMWTKIKEKSLQEKIKSMYSFYFTKFHYVTGHYFRHLYHILSFIEQTEDSLTNLAKSENEIIEKKKMTKKYIDFLQSQMSSFELMLLFYNSLIFPKTLSLIIKYNFLENLAIEDLIDANHNCIEGIQLKNRRTILGLD